MSFLYIVVMMAASTKYSINSYFSPAPMSLPGGQKFAQGMPRSGHPS